MRYEVSLRKCPDDLNVPDDLEQRFWYDAEGLRLCFSGFMSKAVYDRLRILSHDRYYLSALDELFRNCVPEEKNMPRSPKTVPAIVALSAVALLGVVVWFVLTD